MLRTDCQARLNNNNNERIKFARGFVQRLQSGSPGHAGQSAKLNNWTTSYDSTDKAFSPRVHHRIEAGHVPLLWDVMCGIRTDTQVTITPRLLQRFSPRYTGGAVAPP